MKVECVKRHILFHKETGLLEALLTTGLCTDEGFWIITCDNNIDVMRKLQEKCTEYIKSTQHENYHNYKLCFANEDNYNDLIQI
jgi:hypothetical protein